MKNLKLGVVILEGVAALISVGIGVYQVIEIVKTEQANKKVKNKTKEQSAIDVQVVETC